MFQEAEVPVWITTTAAHTQLASKPGECRVCPDSQLIWCRDSVTSACSSGMRCGELEVRSVISYQRKTLGIKIWGNSTVRIWVWSTPSSFDKMDWLFLKGYVIADIGSDLRVKNCNATPIALVGTYLARCFSAAMCGCGQWTKGTVCTKSLESSGHVENVCFLACGSWILLVSDSRRAINVEGGAQCCW